MVVMVRVLILAIGSCGGAFAHYYPRITATIIPRKVKFK